MAEIDYVIAQSEQIVRDFEKTKRAKAVTLEEMQAVHTSKQIAEWLTELKILRSLNSCDRPQSGWITNRTPTQEECEQAGDTGFILCVSGRKDNWNYDHAIVMTDNFYDNGWYVDGFSVNMYNLTIHGWMMPPSWGEPIRRWIPVKEKLPDNRSHVMTTIKPKNRSVRVRSGWYDDGLFMNDNGDTWKSSDKEVLAWMPLPEPYSGDNTDEQKSRKQLA